MRGGIVKEPKRKDKAQFWQFLLHMEKSTMEKLDSFFGGMCKVSIYPIKSLFETIFFNPRRVVRMRKDLGFVLLASASQVKGRQGLAYA